VTEERIPRFAIGDVVRLLEPERFVEQRKLENRDAVVLANILDYGWGSTRDKKSFQGRIQVEFQKRNGRGKVFREIMNERNFGLATPASPTKEAP